MDAISVFVNIFSTKNIFVQHYSQFHDTTVCFYSHSSLYRIDQLWLVPSNSCRTKWQSPVVRNDNAAAAGYHEAAVAGNDDAAAVGIDAAAVGIDDAAVGNDDSAASKESSAPANWFEFGSAGSNDVAAPFAFAVAAVPTAETAPRAMKAPQPRQ